MTSLTFGLVLVAALASGAPGLRGSVAVAIQPQRIDIDSVVDGPHVFWRDPRTVEILSFHGGRVHREVREEIDGEITIEIPGSPLGAVVIDSTVPTVPPWSWKAPDRLLAVSDLEGNYATLRAYLQGVGVVDEDGGWSWGDGHLLFGGDMVDRGDQVTEVLWFVLRLEREARQAGGRVHYVLGNHEAMVMQGDLRYIHPKYGLLCRRYELGYDELYGPTSHVGRWWRTRNAIEVIDRLLFVHAGYSPAVDRLDVGPDRINEAIRSHLGTPRFQGTGLAMQLSSSLQGPLWYRGYFPRYAAQFGPFPTPAQLDSILKRHDVDHIIVGHTVVPDVGWLDAGKQLIGIDVKWSKSDEAEGLLWTPEGMWRVDGTGRRRELAMLGK